MPTPKTPLLTICVTTYNNEKTIEKTMQSVLNQTYPNFEILVSDNNSTDKTLKIVSSFKSPNIFIRKNIKKIKSEKWYIGGYDNCNGCIKSGLIKGEFVAFWHSDDIYEKDMAKKEVEFLMQNQKAGAVFTMGKIINANDQVIGQHTLSKELSGKNTFNFREIFENTLTHGNLFLITPTFMARTAIFKKAGLFAEEKFKTSADLEMWLRILKHYEIGILKESLINRRTGGVSKSYNALRTAPADYFTVMDYILQRESAIWEIKNKFLRQYSYQKDFDNTIIAMHLTIKNQIKEAKKILNNSFSLQNLRAFFENMTFLRAKALTLKIILFIGINLGLGKPLGKILYKII